MEYFTVYNKYGEKTVQTVERKEAHKEGICHRVFHLWIVNPLGQVLVQQRSAIKDTGANLWYVSVGGHIESDESIEQAIIRETSEELGLEITSYIDDVKYLYTFQEKIYLDGGAIVDNEFYDVFVLKMDVPLNQVTMQKSEVQAVKYMDYADFKREVLKVNNSFVPHQNAYKLLVTTLDDYFEALA